jgi:predicted amidohydrolase
MKLGLVQYNPHWEDKSKNQEKILSLINSIPSPPDILIFPEMSLTGYTMNTSLGEPFDLSQSQTLQFFSNLSKEKSINTIAGFIELDQDKVYNTLFVINREGKVISKYRKIHLFSFAGEERHYRSGDKPEIVSLENIKIGLSICYDLRFPEMFRFYAKEKVDLIVNIANWPDTRIEHYVHLLKARAIENQCFVAGVNRVGKTRKDNYDGRSSVFDPLGNEIISVKNEERIIIAEIDLKKVELVRSKFPFLDDIKLI